MRALIRQLIHTLGHSSLYTHLAIPYISWNDLKGQCHEIFDFFFMNQFPPSPWEYHFKFLENSRGYSQLKVHHRCRWHRWQMEKIFIQVLIILFGHLWEVELTYRYIFAFKVTFRSQQPGIVPIQYVSTTLAKLVAKFAPVSLIPLENLPPVSLIPVVHLDFRISPQIFEKIRNGPNGILWGWGETDSWKNQKQKIL